MKEFPAAITVCDGDGVLLEMNDKSIETFQNDGGAELIGKNLLDCHPEPSRTILVGLLNDKKVNAYTIEKNGRKKLIYQAPWFVNGTCRGLVELSLEIPFDMPHFMRDKAV
jgi:transcriptional regulator with PAS, ATPase and Fis domain